MKHSCSQCGGESDESRICPDCLPGWVDASLIASGAPLTPPESALRLVASLPASAAEPRGAA